MAKKMTYKKFCSICDHKLFNIDERILGHHRHCKKRKEKEQKEKGEKT